MRKKVLLALSLIVSLNAQDLKTSISEGNTGKFALNSKEFNSLVNQRQRIRKLASFCLLYFFETKIQEIEIPYK